MELNNGDAAAHDTYVGTSTERSNEEWKLRNNRFGMLKLPSTPSKPRSSPIKRSGSFIYPASDRFIPSSSSSGAFRMCSPVKRQFIGVKSKANKTADESDKHEPLLAYALELDAEPKVFSYTPTRAEANTRTLPSRQNTLTPKKEKPVSLLPSRILDAPGLRDDFYTTVLAWSPVGDLAVGLAENVYLWNECAGPSLLSEGNVCDVSSLSYSYTGQILAVGRVDGTVQLWSKGESRPRITIRQPGDVGCMAWQPLPGARRLLIGKGTGHILLYDIVWGKTISKPIFVGEITNAHEEQVCGLAWNHDGTQFASGGNDNRVCLFNNEDWKKPLFVWRHNAAVKALAFCPWQKSLLATGAGSHDKCIRFFNCFTGKKVNELYCGAQVTSILWSPRHKEFCASFGYSLEDVEHRLAVYSWPQLQCIVSVPPTWSDMRAVYAINTSKLDEESGAVEPDCTVIVGSSDETIKFFNLWGDGHWHNRRVIAWHGIFDSKILEMMEGIDSENGFQIR
ncbi:Cdc20/Fizzy family WD repeat protein [Schizosaccharomyces japonicus yFS275]|uniref:Cdc20/Fizzy family WD repeat protein n=1 Tax=Schizosaccharomyces japonicus (strain yFS275 / FY16936) TaxID=402676 RepID=B6K589_SCHJY|nr:Cdc20/Fizzy family WD repeat protein [Schizosaccharomyces japonicus yFS275]EEB08693.1 Cdc20/Fizzy family WD repeat protein [Schizosaccharomyces japonicus yFS275]